MRYVLATVVNLNGKRYVNMRALDAESEEEAIGKFLLDIKRAEPAVSIEAIPTAMSIEEIMVEK